MKPRPINKSAISCRVFSAKENGGREEPLKALNQAPVLSTP
jgi:hypothetical protein